MDICCEVKCYLDKCHQSSQHPLKLVAESKLLSFAKIRSNDTRTNVVWSDVKSEWELVKLELQVGARLTEMVTPTQPFTLHKNSKSV